MNDKEAFEAAKSLIEWARSRWGVKTERVWRCPLSDGHHVYEAKYEGYCPDDGRKLRQTTVESQSQDWQYKLSSFIDFPEYPEPPKEDDV